jgi:hypothetical protein
VPKNSFQIYSAAALLAIGMVPYTMIFMLPTNNKLMAKAEQAAGAKGAVAADDKEVIELLGKWSILSGIRSLVPLLGGVVSMAANLHKIMMSIQGAAAQPTCCLFRAVMTIGRRGGCLSSRRLLIHSNLAPEEARRLRLAGFVPKMLLVFRLDKPP